MDAFTRLDQQQFEAAKRQVSELQASLPKAVRAYYETHSQQIVIQLSSRVEMRFSPEDAEGLEHADPADLDWIEITGSGFGIQFPHLDVVLSVPAVLLGRLGSESWMAKRRKEPAEQTEFWTGSGCGRKGEKKPILVETNLGKRNAWHGLRPINGGLAASRAPERGEAKVEKYQDYDRSNHKHAVIRTVGPVRAHAPEIRSERNDWQKKEGARDFEPQNAPYAAKRSQKPANTPGDARTRLRTDAECVPRVLRMNPSADSSLRGSRRSGVRTFRKPLSHHAARDPYADSEDASNRLWSHPIYDGSSDSA